ncbi:ImmA/IrrE family metallo-endopeptidase [Novosphingobium sediminicola]|uniref:Zn-dependent peptidase ImmA (M78 family) n=1 Tax=Novosphingobium sediminicola TaxID=563162 RepID=A0A7W6CKU2_9SPHN|nr:ImmA/IrrE family metallo-endopeptidase [Novosphingobium sediminicola]MBB3956258.1 Zn-dependent peptidase ImmA (M78 family) [Novosphingobium sediminicola]
MVVNIPPDDPAKQLWLRADKADLAKFWDIFDAIPVKVGAIAERLGLEVLSVTLSTDVSGLIRKREDGIYEIQVNNTDAAVRQRFTVCHEISHYLLHRNLIDAEGITDNILYRSKLTSRQEVEANKLGAAMLMPWLKISEWHYENYRTPPHKENIEQIASAFRASSLAVGFRLGI